MFLLNNIKLVMTIRLCNFARWLLTLDARCTMLVFSLQPKRLQDTSCRSHGQCRIPGVPMVGLSSPPPGKRAYRNECHESPVWSLCIWCMWFVDLRSCTSLLFVGAVIVLSICSSAMQYMSQQKCGEIRFNFVLVWFAAWSFQLSLDLKLRLLHLHVAWLFGSSISFLVFCGKLVFGKLNN